MNTQPPIPPLTFDPRQLKIPDLRVATIGSGILRAGHLPGYRKINVNVVATCDIRREAAEKLAADFQIAQAFGSVDELLAWGDFDLVDVAIPNTGRLELVEKLARAGKHILIQKPLSDRYETARRTVEIAEQYGVVLAVNQNSRWSPTWCGLRHLLQAGLAGEPYLLTRHVEYAMDHMASWNAHEERYLICEYHVHDFDAMRFVFGQEPLAVTCVTARKPAQHFKGELFASISIQFPRLMAHILGDGIANPSSPARDDFLLQGTEAAIAVASVNQGPVNLYRGGNAGAFESLQVPWGWFPDAFIGPMADLLNAIVEKRPPICSGRDNLKTVAISEAAYRSATLARTVALSEIE